MKYEEAEMTIVYFDGDVFADLTVKSTDQNTTSKGNFSELFGGNTDQ
ncbi:MAG: hypothetical protein LUG86_09250 [Oscillospiraceae bacterium]|nr:hypothetical protein [Oscillospiraceae bacterium]